MKFQVSEKFKINGRRKIFLASMSVVVLIVGSVWMFINSASAVDKIMSVIVIFILSRYLPPAYQSIKNNDS